MSFLSTRSALETMPVVPPRRLIYSERSVSVTMSWRWKSPPIVEHTILLLSCLPSVVTPPSRGTTSLPRFVSTIFLLFFIYFTSLVTASTKSFVSTRLITATFGVCSSSSILVTASRCSARFKLFQMQCLQNCFNFHTLVADLLSEM